MWAKVGSCEDNISSGRAVVLIRPDWSFMLFEVWILLDNASGIEKWNNRQHKLQPLGSLWWYDQTLRVVLHTPFT